jgi:ABC-type antimicrobial peptide transport system permease subunit
MQFSVSIILIISTVIVFQQIQHVKSRDIGYNRNNLIEADVQGNLTGYYESLKHDLLNSGVVENVALSNHTMLYGGNNTGGFNWEGKTPGAQILISMRYVTPEYFNTAGMKLLNGRGFLTTDSGESKNMNVIITKSFEKLMGKETAVGKIIREGGDTTGTQINVVGVTNDYIYGNMYGTPDPVMFICTSPAHTNKMYLRLKDQSNAEKALAVIEAAMKKNNPAYPFNYRFVDEQFNWMFQNEALISKLSRVFAALAIVISCLGLFGLAAFTAERRTKEIGVRKVLGASIPGIASLVSKDFLKLVAVACLVAFPLAWWIMNSWLNNYQYRVGISWWIFLIAGAVAIVIAILTVSYQSIKAAVANPIKSLRTE